MVQCVVLTVELLDVKLVVCRLGCLKEGPIVCCYLSFLLDFSCLSSLSSTLPNIYQMLGPTLNLKT